MSIRRVIKVLKNIRSYADEYSDEQNPFYRQKTSELGEEIRDRLIQGLVSGYDINGHRFQGLEESTMEVRSYRGISSSSPLRAEGGIESFLSSSNLFTTGTLQVKLNTPPEEYMGLQNEGFTPTYVPGVWKDGYLAIKRGGGIAFVRNRNNVSVPPRTWYGIPKTYREGGGKYKEFINKIAKALDIEFGKAIKKG
tara:strand:+ start:427 stop:1011 length:585 start_codon:yes stop_codon:yes gene_type:complete